MLYLSNVCNIIPNIIKRIPVTNGTSKFFIKSLNMYPIIITGMVVNSIRLNAVLYNFTLFVNIPKIILNITFLKYINNAKRLPPCNAIFNENDISLNDNNFEIKVILVEELIGKNSPIPCTTLNVIISKKSIIHVSDVTKQFKL